MTFITPLNLPATLGNMINVEPKSIKVYGIEVRFHEGGVAMHASEAQAKLILKYLVAEGLVKTEQPPPSQESPL